MLDFMAHLGPVSVYPAFFIGIIFFGGLVLLPAMYLSLVGSVSIGYLFLVAILAGAAADTFWYVIGRSAKKEKLYSLRFIEKRIEEAKRFSTFFEKHGAILVFVTKFIYGTRIASHILAGMHKIRFLKFLSATATGTAVWFGLLYFLLRSIDMGVAGVKETATRVQVIFLVLIIVIVAMNWFTGTYVRSRMMKRP